MRLSEFILLNEVDKKETVLHQGILIGKRKGNSRIIFLFQMENYYVETFCNMQNKAIEEYRIFHSLHPLAPYIDSIGLNDLFN